MTGEFSMPIEGPATGALRRAAVSLLLGAGFTAMLFLGLAHLEHAAPGEEPPLFSDLQSIAPPLEAPPPPPTLSPAASDAAPAPLVGSLGVDTGDVGAPVTVKVSPREVSQLLPVHAVPPSMKALTQAQFPELRPKMDLAPEFQRIYQLTDVDERPRVLVEAKPYIPPVVRNGARVQQVTLLFVVDTTGAVASVRIVVSSGNKHFDEIVADCVKREWMFSPAVKRGKKVKCMIQRAIIVKWVSSPFGD